MVYIKAVLKTFIFLLFAQQINSYKIYVQNITDYNNIYTFYGTNNCTAVLSTYVTLCSTTSNEIQYNQYSSLNDCIQYGCDTATNITSTVVGIEVNTMGLSGYIIYYQSECDSVSTVWTDWVQLPVSSARSTQNRCVIRNTNYTCNVDNCISDITVYEHRLVVPTGRSTFITDVCNYDAQACIISPDSTYPYNYPAFFFGSSSPVTDGWKVYFQGYRYVNATNVPYTYTTYTLNITQNNINILSTNPYEYVNIKSAVSNRYNSDVSCAVFYITGNNVVISGFNISNTQCNSSPNTPISRYPLIVVNGNNTFIQNVYGFTYGVIAYIYNTVNTTLEQITAFDSSNLANIFDSSYTVANNVYPLQYVYVGSSNDTCSPNSNIDIANLIVFCRIFNYVVPASCSSNIGQLRRYITIPSDINETLIGIIVGAIAVFFLVIIIFICIHNIKQKKEKLN